MEVSVLRLSRTPLSNLPTPRTGPVLFAVIRENSCNKAIQLDSNRLQKTKINIFAIWFTTT